MIFPTYVIACHAEFRYQNSAPTYHATWDGRGTLYYSGHQWSLYLPQTGSQVRVRYGGRLLRQLIEKLP